MLAVRPLATEPMGSMLPFNAPVTPVTADEEDILFVPTEYRALTVRAEPATLWVKPEARNLAVPAGHSLEGAD